jgi:hypothetical protein
MTFRRIRSAVMPIGSRVELWGAGDPSVWVVDAIEDDPAALWQADFGDDADAIPEMAPESYIVVLRAEET